MSAPQVTYVTAIGVDDLFADPEYQRELDVNRARNMARTWDPRLVGVLDVSDRGEHTPPNSPRYALINGQHRWKAAVFLDPTMSLVCNVHTGLTVADEAQLFYDIDARTKGLSSWDRWKSRRSAGDPVVTSIDLIAADLGLVIAQGQGKNRVHCYAALEYLYDKCLPETVHDVLEFCGDVWPGAQNMYNSAIVKGVGKVLHDNAVDLDTGRLADALSEMTPGQLLARAHELKASQPSAGIPRLVTVAAIQAYNRRGRSKLAPPPVIGA